MERVTLPLVPIHEPAPSTMDEEIAEGFLPIRRPQEDLHSLLCGIRCMLLRLIQMDKANGIRCPCILPAGLLTFPLLPQNLITNHTLNTHEVPHLPQAPCRQFQRRGMTVGGHKKGYSFGFKFGKFYMLLIIFSFSSYPTTHLAFCIFLTHVFFFFGNHYSSNYFTLYTPFLSNNSHHICTKLLGELVHI